MNVYIYSKLIRILASRRANFLNLSIMLSGGSFARSIRLGTHIFFVYYVADLLALAAFSMSLDDLFRARLCGFIRVFII